MSGHPSEVSACEVLARVALLQTSTLLKGGIFDELSSTIECTRRPPPPPKRPMYVQGFQMVYFHTKHPNLGIFWRALELKMFVYFMTNLIFFTVIGYILCHFGIVCSLLVCLDKESLATLHIGA
jgi:hypothetical protein